MRDKSLRRAAAVAAILLGLLLPLVPAQFAQAAGPTVVSITWAGGHKDAMPGLDAMKARGLKTTIYVNSQRVGTDSLIMTQAQLKGYADGGFEIGGYTLNHENLTTLTPDAAKANICADRTNITNIAGSPPSSFAYPFGAVNDAVVQAVKDCGYSSARTLSDLRTPVSCFGCPPAETIPPIDPYRIRTPGIISSAYTLADLQGIVTRAEATGGWVSLVFERVCNACTSNSITQANFNAFLDWLQARSATTSIKTVGEVIGGQVQPPPPPPAGNSAVIGSQSRTINGTNTARLANQLVLYTPAKGATTGANQYGTEVSVVNGVVTAVQNSVGNMAIPANGVVLSGHGTSATWLKTYATVGAAVTIGGQQPPPPPPTGIPTTTVAVGAGRHDVNGTNIARGANQLIVYTPAKGATTGTNPYGFEAAVVNGVVTQVANGVGNMAIPANGYVLSGHGTSRTWLAANAVVGAIVTP